MATTRNAWGCLPVDYTRFCHPSTEFRQADIEGIHKASAFLRFEVVIHNVRDLDCGRVVARFPEIVARLKGMLGRFLTTLDCVDVAFSSDQTLERLPLPSRLGKPVWAGSIAITRVSVVC